MAMRRQGITITMNDFPRMIVRLLSPSAHDHRGKRRRRHGRRHRRRHRSEGGPLTYALLDDAGGRFVLKGNQLVVKNGALLDYETARSHTIKLQVKDSQGYTLEKTFTIGVTDVAEAKILIGTADADTLTGDSLNDILSGLAGKDTSCWVSPATTSSRAASATTY